LSLPKGLVAADDNTLYFSSEMNMMGGPSSEVEMLGEGLFKLDLNSGTVTQVASGWNYGPLSIDLYGKIITSSSSDIVRIDPETGASEVLSDSCETPLGIRGIQYYNSPELLPAP
jgi:hypothetical protein